MTLSSASTSRDRRVGVRRPRGSCRRPAPRPGRRGRGRAAARRGPRTARRRARRTSPRPDRVSSASSADSAVVQSSVSAPSTSTVTWCACRTTMSAPSASAPDALTSSRCPTVDVVRVEEAFDGAGEGGDLGDLAVDVERDGLVGVGVGRGAARQDEGEGARRDGQDAGANRPMALRGGLVGGCAVRAVRRECSRARCRRRRCGARRGSGSRTARGSSRRGARARGAGRAAARHPSVSPECGSRRRLEGGVSRRSRIPDPAVTAAHRTAGPRRPLDHGRTADLGRRPDRGALRP